MLGKKTKDGRPKHLPGHTRVSQIKILTLGFPIVQILSVFVLLLKADDNIAGALNTTLQMRYELIL